MNNKDIDKLLDSIKNIKNVPHPELSPRAMESLMKLLNPHCEEQIITKRHGFLYLRKRTLKNKRRYVYQNKSISIVVFMTYDFESKTQSYTLNSNLEYNNCGHKHTDNIVVIIPALIKSIQEQNKIDAKNEKINKIFKELETKLIKLDEKTNW
jgi:hypothetical protein